MHRKDVLRRLLDRTSISPPDLVVDVGAGEGQLTAELRRRGLDVVAYEIDQELVERLRNRFAHDPNVVVRDGDFLSARLPANPFKVFANLPFNVTADTINKLTAKNSVLTDAYLLVQMEAAERFAGIGAGGTTLVSLLLKPRWRVEILRAVPVRAFHPIPQVQVCFMRIARRQVLLVAPEEEALYRDFAVHGFSGRAPSVGAVCSNIFTSRQFARLAHDHGFGSDATPTQLGSHQWLSIFDFFRHNVAPAKRDLIRGSARALDGQQRRLRKDHRTRSERRKRR